MAYLGQFDDLVRDSDRGRAIRHTRTVAVFDDGLVVCPVSVYGAGKPAGRWRPRRPARPAGSAGGGGDDVRATASALGDGARAHAFAEVWPQATLIPFAAIDAVVLTRPQQVTRLVIRLETSGPEPAESVLLGNLDADRVRAVLGPLLGDRLQTEIPGS